VILPALPEVPLRQLIWPLLMLLLVAYAVRLLWCRYRTAQRDGGANCS
jgi:hypothetical protein